MSKNFFITVVCAIGFGGVLISSLPTIAFAAQVNFKVVPNIVAGDTATILEVRIDPEHTQLNAIEGILRLEPADGVVISSVITETGNSLLALWPQVPTYSPEEKVIRFSGGAAHGFSDEGLLFRVRLFTETPGKVSLSWIGGSAYRDDGKGTLEPVSSRSITIALAQSIPNPINAASVDSKPPYFDMVEVGKDPDVYEGKYFLSFHAIDDLSGIDRYEVSEDQVVTKVMEGVYVLSDQERNARVVLTAYDKAGNSISIKVPTKYEKVIRLIVFSVILLACVLLLLRKKIRMFLKRL